MTSNAYASVVAIGVDAAEASLVRRLIAQGKMPALASLLKEGRWLRVHSPAGIGSGSVWPTFMTGSEPGVHGIYSEWSWQPETMNLTRYDGRSLQPFWKSLARQNISVGILDVPFAHPLGLPQGFEVLEWWAHDATVAGLRVGPKEIVSLVKDSPAHPLSATRFVNTTPDAEVDLEALAKACIEGVRLRSDLARQLIKQTRPRLSLVVFPEIHHAGHLMWHTAERDDSLYADQKENGDAGRLLERVYGALDEHIGRLIEVVGDDSVMIFALHGMRAGRGLPTFLGPWLCERGFSSLESWGSQSWPKRAQSLLAATKRHTPDYIKQRYYKLTPAAATQKLARPFMWPLYDWKTTRAFSLPTDQNGWIRINLAGREAEGIVSAESYDKICRELEKLLLGLITDDGSPLVRDITRTATDSEGALRNPLPDLVVHWDDAAFASPLKIKGSKIKSELVGKKLTGQHAANGFCIYRGSCDLTTDEVAASDLGQLMTASLL